MPIRRTKAADWAPLAKAVHAYAEERQIPFVADMNADFRDGYGSVPMSNTWDKRAIRIDLLPHRRCPPPAEPHGHNARNGHRACLRRTPCVRCHRDRQWRAAGIFRPRDYYLARWHSFTRISHASRNWAGSSAAGARDRGARGQARRRRKLIQSRHPFYRAPTKARHAPSGQNSPPSDDMLPLLLQPARRAAARYVSKRPVQDVMEPARASGRKLGALAAQADGARSCGADGGRSGDLSTGRIQFYRPRARPEAVHARLPPLRRYSGA